MSERKYRISMCVPLGIRRGTLRLHTEDGYCNGFIDLMGHTDPFHGTMTPDGRCSIEGELTTLMRSIRYAGGGIIEGDTLRLSIRSGSSTYHIEGTIEMEGVQL